MPGPLRKLRDWLNAADVTAALESQLEAGMVTIGGGSGDVVQIADLPAEVAEAFGINTVTERISRGQAMSIPAMAQARDTIAATIGTFPLLATRAAGEVAAPRAFLAQPDPRTTRQWLITWTVDDLMFGPVAWWWVDSYDAAGFPATAHRIAPHRVTIRPGGVVCLDNTPLTTGQLDRLIRFDGPHEGLLARGVVALRTALMLEQAARKYAKAETPGGILRDTRPPGIGSDLKTEEIDALLALWRKLRAAESTAYLPRSVEYLTPGHTSARELQLLEARQHSALEIARLANLDADAVNAPAASGMTYQNGVDRRRGRLDGAFRPYLEAIAGRLSMPDVTPRGHVVTFDTATWLLGDAAERVSTAVAAAGRPVLDVDEARRLYLGLPPNAKLTDTPAPAPAPQEGTADAPA